MSWKEFEVDHPTQGKRRVRVRLREGFTTCVVSGDVLKSRLEIEYEHATRGWRELRNAGMRDEAASCFAAATSTWSTRMDREQTRAWSLLTRDEREREARSSWRDWLAFAASQYGHGYADESPKAEANFVESYISGREGTP